jgi:hypothetical protein
MTALPEGVRDEYIARAQRFYVTGALTLADLEAVLDLLLRGSAGPRAVRERLELEYGIDRMDWICDDLLDG